MSRDATEVVRRYLDAVGAPDIVEALGGSVTMPGQEATA
jgi:hypothetical protein